MLDDEDFINDSVLTNEKVVRAVVTAYLNSLKKKDKVSVLGTDGAVALFVSKKPTTLKEAKELADVIHYAVSIAAVNGLDLNSIIIEKDRAASIKYNHKINLEDFILNRVR